MTLGLREGARILCPLKVKMKLKWFLFVMVACLSIVQSEQETSGLQSDRWWRKIQRFFRFSSTKVSLKEERFKKTSVELSIEAKMTTVKFF